MVSTEQLSEQAAVTDWPMRILLVLLTVAVIALALWGLRRGWRNRAGRQNLVLPTVPPDVAAAPGEGVTGKYLGTVPQGQPMERLVAAGAVARAAVIVSPAGVLLRRQGEDPLFIPHDDIVSVTTAAGLLMRYYGGHGVLLVNWTWSGAAVSSGIWFADPDAQTTVRHRIERVHLEEVT